MKHTSSCCPDFVKFAHYIAYLIAIQKLRDFRHEREEGWVEALDEVSAISSRHPPLQQPEIRGCHCLFVNYVPVRRFAGWNEYASFKKNLNFRLLKSCS